MTTSNAPRQDVYTRITDKIIADLAQGVSPWMKPWNAEHAAGRITRPLRHNGQPYNGINILVLWSTAVTEGYSAPIWMTYRQATELGAHVRKGQKGELVVYANTVTRTEVDEATGEDVEHAIPFMKGYTVFNVEQIEGLPSHYYQYQLAEPALDPVQRIDRAEGFFAATGADIRHGGNQAYYAVGSDPEAISSRHWLRVFLIYTNNEMVSLIAANLKSGKHQAGLSRNPVTESTQNCNSVKLIVRYYPVA